MTRNITRTILFVLLLAVLQPPVHVSAQGILNPFSGASKVSSFGAMASVPVGQFSSTDLENGGFAKTGWGFFFDSKTVLKNGLSFISHSTYSWVPFNQAAMATTFSSELGKHTTVTGGKYMPFLTTLGVGYEFHPAPFLTFGITAQGGLMYNSSKSFELTVYDTDNTTVLFKDDMKFDAQFSLAYVFGAQVNFRLIKDLIDFQITGDYSASQFNSTLRGQNLDPIKTKQQIQLVNFGAGIVVHTK